MATALRERPQAAAAAEAANAARNDDEPMSTDPLDPAPTRYFFLDIVLDEDAVGELQFFFLNPLPAAALPPGGIDQVIDELVNPVPLAAAAAAVAAAVVEETPLDIKVRTPAFIILRLGAPANMTFDPDKRAIGHKNRDHAPHYGGLRHVDPNGVATAAPVKDCRLIYFMVDPPDAAVPGGDPEYEHGFNLHVRLRQRPRGMTPRSIKLRIDPDVRYPGGGNVGDP